MTKWRGRLCEELARTLLKLEGRWENILPAKKTTFCQSLKKTTFDGDAELPPLPRSCVEALRLLGEAGKCRKLDSQVTD